MHFTLTGNVNLKNCVHWADNNPHDVFANPLHNEKVTLWCGIMRTFILRSYFFEEVTDSDLQTCTITSDRYLDMLTHYAISKLQWQNALSDVVWMQDVAPHRVGSSVKHLLNQQFGA